MSLVIGPLIVIFVGAGIAFGIVDTFSLPAIFDGVIVIFSLIITQILYIYSPLSSVTGLISDPYAGYWGFSKK